MLTYRRCGHLEVIGYTDSDMEAEFVACFEATVQTNWLWNFISGLRVVDNITKPLKIYCDNIVVVFFSKNDKYYKGAKHMELKYFAVKEEVQKHRVSIEHISTNLMIPDPLTKGLPPKVFTGHVVNMGIMSASECWMLLLLVMSIWHFELIIV